MKKPISSRKKKVALSKARKDLRQKIERKNRGRIYSSKLWNVLPDSKTHDTLSKKKHSLSVKFPAIFSIEKNLNEVVEFFKQFSGFKSRCNISHISFDMSDVIDIDICAIVMFLTKTAQLNNEGIRYVGNMPNNEKCKQIFRESGFLQHMKNGAGGEFSNSNVLNLIVRRGSSSTESELTGTTIKKAVCKLTGSEKHYTPVQSIVQEMAGNAVEHAYSHNKHWLFCVNVSGDEITFILSDGGKGILHTLNRKYKKVLDTLNLTSNIDVLYRAFEKKYNSATNEINRNKGLPLIKKISDDQKVIDLKVLTNDVYLHLGDKSKSKPISSIYYGTVYVWRVNKSLLENGIN